MGATDFEHIVAATDEINTAEKAYRRLWDQANSEDGSSSYNGTISTTHGLYQPVPDHSPLSIREAVAYASKSIENGECEKWGACHAVPYFVTEMKPGRTSTKKVSLTHEELTPDVRYTQPGNTILDLKPYGARELGKAIAAKLDLDPNTTIIEVTEIDRKFKKESAATGPKAVTVYDVTVNGVVVDTCDTQAKARKAMDGRLARSMESGREAEASIAGRVIRENSNKLVSGSVRAVKTTFTVKVTPHTSTGQVTERGWVFYGMAAM